MGFVLEDMPERFRSKVEVDHTSGCWVWVAGQNGAGYGTYWTGERQGYAHRFAYEALVGEIPAGLDLDHLCRNRACCNPAHLEPVSRKENLNRSPYMGSDWGAGMAARSATHCKNGHEYTPSNTRIVAGGGRRCRACARELAARTRRDRGGGDFCPPDQHGTINGYSNYMCRCPACGEANRKYLAEYRRDRAAS